MSDTITLNETENQPQTIPDNTVEIEPVRKFDPRDLIGKDGRLLKLQYSIQETAFLLDCDDKTVKRFINERGLLETSKAIRHIKVTADSIRKFMETTV